MNVMTIILSTTASLLVAALILFWQSDNKAADAEPTELQKELTETKAKLEQVTARLKQHEIALQMQAQGKQGNSPYAGNNLQTPILVSKDKSTQAALTQKKGKLEHRLNLTPEVTADSEMQNSALALANGNSGPSTEKQFVDQTPTLSTSKKQLTRTQQQERIREISRAKVQARVKHIKRDPKGDIYLAQLEKNVYLSDGSVLAVRRNTGIAGRVKIVSSQDYGGDLGKVITLEIATRGFANSDLVLKLEDELILPPRGE